MTAPPEEQLPSLQRAGTELGLDIDEYVLPDSIHVVSHGHRIHALDWGIAGNPNVVLLHGHSLTAHTWSLVCLALRRHYRCVAGDLRGHGDSEWSPVLDYSLEAHARDAAGLVEQVGSGEPVVLVGMSLGGMTSLRLTLDRPELVRALVVVDIGPRHETDPPLTMGDTPAAAAFAQPQEMDTLEDFIDGAMAMNPRRDPAVLRVSLQNNLRRTPEGKWTWKYDRRPAERMAAMKATGEAAASRPLADPFAFLDGSIERITCPVLLVRGQHSPLLSPAAAEAFAARFPDGRLVEVAGAGHTVQGDNPKGFVEAVRPFLASVT